MQLDLEVWLKFLSHPSAFCRPFMDFSRMLLATEINMFTDASGKIGFGGICDRSFMHQIWDPKFIQFCRPSIEYLELYAVAAAILAWIERFRNQRIILFCDNKSVVDMLNASTSSCKNCMILIRIIVLHCMVHNVRVFARHIRGDLNYFADILSRDKMQIFKQHKQGRFEENSTKIPDIIWPVNKVWNLL